MAFSDLQQSQRRTARRLDTLLPCLHYLIADVQWACEVFGFLVQS